MNIDSDIYPDPCPENPIDLNRGALRHNYYTREHFFQPSRETGSIFLKDGQRATRMSEDFIVGLHHGLEEKLDDAANTIMYKCGQEWALQDMKRFNERMRQEYGGGKLDIWQMRMRFVFETWWWPLTVEGWGAWSLDLSFYDNKTIFVEIRNSAVAKSLQQVGKPVCHLYAGMFSGVFSYYQRAKFECIEVQCYAMGHDCCKFLVGTEKQVGAADFWRREGASAEEIRGRLS